MVTTKVTREYAPEQRLPASWLFGAQLSALFILWFFVAVFDKLVTNEYTLCSNNIYTVDDANPHVECIFVRGTIIHDMGSFGIRVHHSGNLPLMFIMQRTSRDVARYKLQVTQAFSNGF